MIFQPFHELGENGDPAAGGRGNVAEFLLRCLLDARSEAEFASNEGVFDEDVNVYLVGLLSNFLQPAYHEEASRYVRAFDIDLADEVARNGDDRLAFRMYKVNADHLLLAIGLFHHVHGARQAAHPLLHREPDEFIGRGGTYYHLASSRLRRLRRRDSGVESALRKLGDRFDRYVEVLRCVRTTYFHLTERLGEGSLYHLTRAPEGAASGDEPLDLAALYDDFLDALSAWKDCPEPETRGRLEQAVQRLHTRDDSFDFELPAGDPGSSSA